MENMKGKTCIVTGANSGMGNVIAIALAKLGARVIIISRFNEKPNSVIADIRSRGKNNEVELFLCDLSSQKQIKELAEKIKEKYPVIDVLVNNAGCMNFGYMETEEGIEKTFATNYLAPFLLTNLLMDNLKRSEDARIINVVSDAVKDIEINFEDLNLKYHYSSFKAYRHSKLALTMFTFELTRRLEKEGVKNIAVNCVHPGIVPNTKLGQGSNLFKNYVASIDPSLILTPEQGAETTIWLAKSDEAKGINGKYLFEKKEAKAIAIAYDLDIAKRLWEESEKLCSI